MLVHIQAPLFHVLPLQQAKATVKDYYTYECAFSTGSLIVFAVLAAYKILLQILALFMAFHTRRIKLKGLNESKEIFAIVYVNTIVLTVIVTVQFALQGFHDASSIVNGLALFIEATLFLGFLFVPKVRNLFLVLYYIISLCHKMGLI